MEGDPLADVLTLASARCVRIGTLKAGGTWALKFPPPEKIKLIAVVKGGCWLAVDGERTPLRLSKSRPNHGLIKLRTTTRNQDGEAVQVSVGSLIVPRRPSSHTDSPSPDNQP